VFESDFGATHYRCPDGVCPSGFTCVAGYCEGSQPGDGGVDGPPLVCAQATLLTDDFEDGVRGSQWSRSFNPSGTALSETGGNLVVTPAIARPTPAFAAYASLYWYDLRGSHVLVEVPQMVDTTSHAQAFLQLTFDSMNYLETVQENGTLSFRKWVGGTVSTAATVPYDPAQHRWWQIRESGGTTYWDTSPDGTNWTRRASDANPSYVGEVQIVIGAGTYQSEANPGSAHFDNVNGGGAPTGQWCPALTFTDNFDDGTQGAVWLPSYANAGCVKSETGGAVVLAPASGGGSECAYWSAFAYDLTEGSMIIEVPAMVNTSTAAYAFFEAYADDGNRLTIEQTQGRLYFRKRVAGTDTNLANVPWDAVSHLWWRVRESGGMAFWETSPDGRAWTPRASAPDPISIREVSVRFGAGAPTRPSTPGAARFDNYNLPP